MADNLSIRRPQDPTQINIHEQWEVNYWCRDLKVTEAQLRAAVQKVGTRTADVRRYFGK